MKHFSLLVLWGFFAMTVSGAEIANYVALKTGANGKITVSGNAALADQKFTPASTFKSMIAWAALEEGLVTPDTKHQVADKYVPNSPRELDLHQALYYSSNNYFDWLGKKLGREKLEKYIAISGYAGGKPPKGWLDNMDLVERGGVLTISPRENYEFMSKLASGKLASSPKIQAALLQVLSWPSTDAKRRIYGKTGTAGGVLWFNGFVVQGANREVVTILVPGDISLRQAVNAKFYELCGDQYDPRWAQQDPK